ncbi:RHS repeat-associated core domain-containing protein, partial [Glycomyces salinus]|uniref:RHS repeat-associated core domain-containing protein n=1 Tax=Glycomyces salinus TaxID=980294 RepID=UPI0018EE054E
AREYDPTLGSFISADPILDPADAQQIGGYNYANYSPVSFADPSGLYITSSDGYNGEQVKRAPTQNQDPNRKYH